MAATTTDVRWEAGDARVDRPLGVRVLDRPPQPGGSRVALLAADRDFADALPAAERAAADAALRLPALTLPAGGWAGPWTDAVVVGGLLSRTLVVQRRPSPELFGVGDVVAVDDAADVPEDADVRWEVHQGATLAILDARFHAAAQRWPALYGVLVRRFAARAQRLACQCAVLHLSRVEDRVERVLWQLADRWGRVTPDGVVVPMALTHEALGRLVGAKRPTVSLALATLAERGTVGRRADGAWVLSPRDC